MADEPKPYRVYRGGRAKGKVPSVRKTGADEKAQRYAGPGPKRPRSKKRRVLRWVGVAFVVFLLWLVAWSLASYFAFRDGVGAANKRVPRSARRALDHQNGALFDTSTTILLLGTDHSRNPTRSGDRHSDSIMLVRTDPGRHRLYYLSIPRDLLVEIPGLGQQKINAAMQAGGPALAIKTVRALTGVSIDHLVLVDFGQFQKLIDAIGGVTIDVKKPIYSNSFDCPFPPARCASWKGWRFAKGPQHMNGLRALIYSRIRENRLDPSENDLTRAERQQQIVQAVLSQIASVGTFFDLPFSGDTLVRPLATDLSAWQLIQLGWVKFRSGATIHCRLGGTLEGGAIRGIEENRAVVDEFLGTSAPQPPAPVSGNVVAPGCAVGNHPIGGK